MSTETIARPATTTGTRAGRPRRLAFRLAGLVAGFDTVGAVVVLADSGTSTGPVLTPGPARTQPAPSMSYPPTTEIFAGCLNDIECTGEPSHLPPGYWDLPVMSPAD